MSDDLERQKAAWMGRQAGTADVVRDLERQRDEALAEVERLRLEIVHLRDAAIYGQCSTKLVRMAEAALNATAPDTSDTVRVPSDLGQDYYALKQAGDAMCEAAFRVTNEYDGVHRLRLAIAEWSLVTANEDGRAMLAAAPRAGREDGGCACVFENGTLTELCKAHAEQMDVYAEAIRAEERERCARIAASYPQHTPFGDDYTAHGMIREGQDNAAREIHAAIRAGRDGGE